MKFFLIVTGRRNEHQRPDRDNYIEMQSSNIQPGLWFHRVKHLVRAIDRILPDFLAMRSVYEKYAQGSNVTIFYPYDYCSITHNEMTDYAQLGTQAFTIKNSQLSRIPRLDRLSEYDCKIVSSVYGCPVSQCGSCKYRAG